MIDLNSWYSDFVHSRKIQTLTFYETKPVYPVGGLVVELGDANPGVSLAGFYPLDDDHRTICKPTSKRAEIHLKTVAFIRDCFKDSGPSKVHLQVVVASQSSLNYCQNSNCYPNMAWEQFVKAHLAIFNLEQNPIDYKYIDVDRGVVLAHPATVGELSTRRVALIHKDCQLSQIPPETVKVFLDAEYPRKI